MHISEKAQRCELSPMRKFHPYAVEAVRQGRKIYHLNIGQPDIPTPAAFFDAVRGFADPVLAYAASPGEPALVEAVRDYYAKLNIPLDASDILITTGGSEALLMLMLSILDPGDEVIVPEPFYPNYNTFIRAAGGVIRPLHTAPEDGYRYADRARFEALINERTRALLITSPGNPTGVVLHPQEMAMLKDVATDHGLYLISDEVYREFIYDGERLHTMLEFADAAENTVIVDSISKRFSACGARVGALISRNRELMQQCLKFCQGRLSVATMDQVGAAALYGVESGYFAATRDEYRRRRDTVVRKLREIPGVICEEPKGAFYLMAALPVDDADAFQRWLLTDFSDRGETVMFAPGEGFYATPGKGRSEIRIAYILCQKDLERAIDLLALGIEAYNRRDGV
ncbi:MAG: pyridoxal phosphate-dependent aminotransferase [Oscillospiraceae bacterium]|nr:pyridoxal phosphate-dependent aminotransferase [Oscillospiraceae bacterium]